MENLKTWFSEKNEDVKEWLKDNKEKILGVSAGVLVCLVSVKEIYNCGYRNGTMNGLNQSLTKDAIDIILEAIKNSNGGIRYNYENVDGTKSAYIFKANKMED